jgi:ABC-type dipeptide/oligopeptide/nickel transport system permease subunit
VKKTMFLVVAMALLMSAIMPGISLMTEEDELVVTVNQFVAYASDGDGEEEPDLDVNIDINGGTDEEGRGLLFYLIVGAVIVVVIVAIVSMTNSKK